MEQRREKLRKNFAELITKAHTYIDAVVDNLWGRDLLTRENLDTIRSCNTPGEKAGRLMSMVRSRGVEGYTAFVDALRTAGEGELADKLDTPLFYTWKYIWSKDNSVMLQSYQKFTSKEVCRKDGEKRHPDYTTYDGPGAPQAILKIKKHYQPHDDDEILNKYHIMDNEGMKEIWAITVVRDNSTVSVFFKCPRCGYLSSSLGKKHSCKNPIHFPYDCVKCGKTVIPFHGVELSEDSPTYLCVWCGGELTKSEQKPHQSNCLERPTPLSEYSCIPPM